MFWLISPNNLLIIRLNLLVYGNKMRRQAVGALKHFVTDIAGQMLCRIVHVQHVPPDARPAHNFAAGRTTCCNTPLVNTCQLVGYLPCSGKSQNWVIARLMQRGEHSNLVNSCTQHKIETERKMFATQLRGKINIHEQQTRLLTHSMWNQQR